MPTPMATTRSNTMVSAKVSTGVATAPSTSCGTECAKLRQPDMLGDVQQNGGDGGHGNRRRIGHEEREHGDEHERVHHAPAMGVRPPAFTLAAVRAMAPVAGIPPKSTEDDVADALGHQFPYSREVTADHGVGHHAGQQRLDGGQNGDGDAVGKLVAEQLPAEVGHMEGGQGAVDDVRSPMVLTSSRPRPLTSAIPASKAMSGWARARSHSGQRNSTARQTTPTRHACPFTVDKLPARAAASPSSPPWRCRADT